MDVKVAMQAEANVEVQADAKVKVTVEYLPATGAAQQSFVLLHGWGCNRQIWRALIPALRPWANLTLVDIPGCAPGVATAQPPGIQETLAGILAAAPPQAVYVGFSLGGQLAVALAAHAPERVAGVITLCSNPCFVAQDGWPGMPADTFIQFNTDVAHTPEIALARFCALQVLGCRQRGPLLRLLRGLLPPAAATQAGEEAENTLHSGLQWLAQLDQRQMLARLAVPQWHLLAAQDALVPGAVAGAMRRILPPGDAAQVHVLEEVGHLAPLAEPETVAALMADFVTANGLREPPVARPAGIPRRAVADSFSRAAGRYDSVAHLQQKVGIHLLESIDKTKADPEHIVDLGCGTGFFASALRERFPGASYLGVDLALGMLKHARAQHAGELDWVAGDAEALPLAAGSVDVLFSSLTLQWCDRLDLFFAEAQRVLAPGGVCVFTTLGPDTLRELRAAWAEVDNHPHVNHFAPLAEVQAAADSARGLALRMACRDYQLSYPRVRDLLDELKALGAHNMNPGRPAGLAGRSALQGMLRAYEQRRRDGMLPATYEVIFGRVEKR